MLQLFVGVVTSFRPAFLAGYDLMTDIIVGEYWSSPGGLIGFGLFYIAAMQLNSSTSFYDYNLDLTSAFSSFWRSSLETTSL
jgi:hypothetical protein